MKRYLTNTILILLFFTLVSFAADKNVLVEVFTNSHCPLCPPAHAAINSYLTNSPNASKVNYIFYHMVFPYPTDQLNIDNPADPAARNNYYGPYSSTPDGFFNGVSQSHSYTSWGSTLNSLASEQSPLEIMLSGSKDSNQQLTVKANISRSGDIADNDLVIHFVVVENVKYQGYNGISHHIHVMRKMAGTPDGDDFTINDNDTKEVDKQITLDSKWDPDSLAVVVFIQSKGSKKVYQSGTIKYSDLMLTDVKEKSSSPKSFKLEQNYPNPFNPSTKISWQTPVAGFQTLKVYDILGNEVATLVNEYKPAGSYEVTFNASNNQNHASLPSGFYIYQLKVGNYVQTRKMILLK